MYMINLFLTCACHRVLQKKEFTTRYNYDVMTTELWTNFQESIDSYLTTSYANAFTTVDLNARWEYFQSAINKAAKLHIPIKKFIKYSPFDIINHPDSDSLKHLNQDLKIVRRCTSVIHHALYMSPADRVNDTVSRQLYAK